MSNKLPVYSHTDSNNSGLNVSTQRFSARILDFSFRLRETSSTSSSPTPPMNRSGGSGEPTNPSSFAGEIDTSNLNPSDGIDIAPSSQNTVAEVSGATTIEVITVEKYKRSDGFANPYHIQGLNATTPDDVDDDDEDEEEEANARLNDSAGDSESALESGDASNAQSSDEGEGDEITLRKDVDDEDLSSNPAGMQALTSRQPSIPASTDSTVSTESRHSNGSSILPAPPPTAGRNDSITSASVSQPQHLFKFTVERVPSSENTSDQLQTDQHSAHITPPVSVSRAPTTESLYQPEVSADGVQVDELVVNETGVPNPDVPSSRSSWMPRDYQAANAAATDLTSPLPHWATAEMAAAAAATAAVASAVVNPVVGAQSSQALPLAQPTGQHFSLAVAAASAAVAAMNNMMIDVPKIPPSNVPPELSAFAAKPALIPSDISSMTTYAASLVKALDDQSRSLAATTLPPSGNQVGDARPAPLGAEDNGAAVGEENDEEIRFRRARFLEKRERWHDKRFLVVDTFRRDDPHQRPNVRVPEHAYPMTCNRCLTRVQQQPIKTRQCHCNTQDSATLRQKVDRFRYNDHMSANHAHVPNRTKVAVSDYFGYPDTVAVMERASQLVSGLAATMHSPHSPTDISNSATAMGTAAAAAAAVASMSNPSGREKNINCSPSSSSISSITLRRNRLQRNNSHFHLARSSPSSFNANEFPQLDKVAAMAAAAVVSVTAAMKGQDRRDISFRSERSSETEIDHPLNPPTSPASGLTRDSQNRSAAVSDVSSENYAAVLKPASESQSVDEKHYPNAAASARDNGEQNSAVKGQQQLTAHSTSKVLATPVINQSNAHMADAPAPLPVTDQGLNQTPPNKDGQENVLVSPPGEAHADNGKGPEPQSTSQPKMGQAGPQQTVESQASAPSQYQQQAMATTQAQPSEALNPQQSQHSKDPTQQQIPHSKQQSQQAPQSSSVPNVPQPSQPTQQSGLSSQNPQGASSASISTTVSGNTGYTVSQPTASATMSATETAVAAAYAACGLMMQGGYGGLSVLGGEQSVLGHGPTNVSSNTSAMNYLDQYRMQHCLPVVQTAPASAAQDSGRQSTEARIAQSLDNVRMAMVSFFREIEEKHNFQVKSLQEEVRQLREQRERDHALIREYVPPEYLRQLGHPYSSLVNMATQSSRATSQGPSANAGNAPSSAPSVQSHPQTVGDHGTSISAPQSHMPPVNSSQSTQPPPQQPE